MRSPELLEAEQAIMQCRRTIDRIRAEVERRRGVGHDFRDAQKRLQTIEQILHAHEVNRARLIGGRGGEHPQQP
jgi:hypothetical protein